MHPSKQNSLVFCLIFLLQAPVGFAEVEPLLEDEMTYFNSYFTGVDGCFILKSLSRGEILRFGSDACTLALSPCSTFKIPHSLAALETDTVTSTKSVIPWDQSKQPVKDWERDHSMATALRNSVVWYYQKIAKKIGKKDMKRFLRKVDYGNESVRGKIDRFWLSGSLKISAQQQVEFLEKLYDDKLQVESAHSQQVKNILLEETRPFGTISAKTGTCEKKGKTTHGWYVGQVENRGQAYVFATMVKDGKNPSGQRAKTIGRRILADLDLF